MTDESKNRYNIENLPISKLTRDGLTTENINYIGAIGRMLSLQDDNIEDFIKKQTDAINLRFDSVDARLKSLEDAGSDREKRITFLEKRASLPYMFIRYGIVILIGIGIGWILHSFL